MSAILLIGAALAHGGHGAEAPWRACDGAEIGASCSYAAGDLEAAGTCRAVSGEALCVRNRPLRAAGAIPAAPPLSAVAAGLAGAGLAGLAIRVAGRWARPA